MYVIVLPVEHLYYLVTFQVAETLSFKCPKYSMLHLYFKKTLKKKKKKKKKIICDNNNPTSFLVETNYRIKKKREKKASLVHGFNIVWRNVCKVTSVFAEGLNHLSFVYFV